MHGRFLFHPFSARRFQTPAQAGAAILQLSFVDRVTNLSCCIRPSLASSIYPSPNTYLARGFFVEPSFSFSFLHFFLLSFSFLKSFLPDGNVAPADRNWVGLVMGNCCGSPSGEAGEEDPLLRAGSTDAWAHRPPVEGLYPFTAPPMTEDQMLALAERITMLQVSGLGYYLSALTRLLIRRYPWLSFKPKRLLKKRSKLSWCGNKQGWSELSFA